MQQVMQAAGHCKQLVMHAAPCTHRPLHCCMQDLQVSCQEGLPLGASQQPGGGAAAASAPMPNKPGAAVAAVADAAALAPKPNKPGEHTDPGEPTNLGEPTDLGEPTNPGEAVAATAETEAVVAVADAAGMVAVAETPSSSATAAPGSCITPATMMTVAAGGGGAHPSDHVHILQPSGPALCGKVPGGVPVPSAHPSGSMRVEVTGVACGAAGQLVPHPPAPLSSQLPHATAKPASAHRHVGAALPQLQPPPPQVQPQQHLAVTEAEHSQLAEAFVGPTSPGLAVAVAVAACWTVAQDSGTHPQSLTNLPTS